MNTSYIMGSVTMRFNAKSDLSTSEQIALVKDLLSFLLVYQVPALKDEARKELREFLAAALDESA